MKSCRICSSKLGSPFLSLGAQPLSNAYLTNEHVHTVEPFFPLEVFVCPQCFLIQIDEFKDARDIFSKEYAYFSSYSDSWLVHCKAYCQMMINRFSISPQWSVIEVASNDGYLLQYFKEAGIPVLGIEPAQNAAEVAQKKGVPTNTVYFTPEYALELVRKGVRADLLIANNVLAHNPAINDFVAAMKILLNSSGIITLEFPHALSMMLHGEFDTIYHEHYSYLSMTSINVLVRQHDLEVFDVEELTTHGGSLRLYVKHKDDSSKAITPNIGRILLKEKESGLLAPAIYSDFRTIVEKVKRDLLLFLIEQTNAGKTIVGYGAAAKGNTLLNYCGIRTDFIEYVVDRNPHKQGRYLPGTHIPVFDPEKIKQTKPDFVIILPWNIKEEIIEQMYFIREWGGKFVVAIPSLKVLS